MERFTKNRYGEDLTRALFALYKPNSQGACLLESFKRTFVTLVSGHLVTGVIKPGEV